MPNLTMPNTWLASCDRHYSYQTSVSQPPQGLSGQSSPISPQQFEGWFGNSSFSASDLSDFSTLPSDSSPYQETEEEVGAKTEHEQVHEHGGEHSVEKRAREASDTDEQESPKKKRRRGGKDSEDGGERKMIRSSRACTVCRKFKAKCIPGPSLHEPSEDSPCMRCATTGQDCRFLASNRGKYPTKKFARLQKQLERMEDMLRVLDEAMSEQSRYRPSQSQLSDF